MQRSGQQFGEEPFRRGGGLRGDGGGRFAAELREELADLGNVAGFGEQFAVFAGQMGDYVRGQGRRQVGGVGFEQEMAGGHRRGVFARARVFRAGEGAAEGNVDVVRGEGGEGVAGAGVGVDEQAGGMRRKGEQDFQHARPRVAAVEAGGEGEFIGELELGAEDGFAVGVQVVAHAGVQADFADAGRAGREDFAEIFQPAVAAAPDEPRVDAEGANHAGLPVGEGADGGPVGFAGGVDMEDFHPGGAGAGEDLRQMGRQARILQVGVGVGPDKFLTVRSRREWYAHDLMVKGRSISVNPQKWRGAVLGILLAAAGAGCCNFGPYQAGMERTTLAPLREGRETGYRATFGACTNEGNSRVAFLMEMGRAAQLEGDFAVSREAFAGAIAATKAQDEKAAISASGAAAQSAAVLVNDNVIPYRASAFERTLVHHYQALNYLATNDLVGAGVEARLANREQEEARKRREREVEEAKSKNGNAPPDEEARDPNVPAVYAGLDEAAGAVKFSFQNAAAFYLAAVIGEMLGERNDAYIDCKKALEIYPDNLFLQMDVVRLGKRLGMREDLADFERRFPRALKMPADGSEALAGKARLVVFYEEGLAPKKTEMSVAYPLPAADSVGAIALPMYVEMPPPPVPASVALGGQPLASTAPICNVGALAARALAEQMPGILTRQVARVVAKTVAAKAAKDELGEWGGLAMALYNVLSEQADLRSWLTLPAHVQILSAWVDPGTPVAALSAPGAGAFWSGAVTLKAGKTTLVYVTRIDSAVFSQVMVQP